MLLWLRGPEGGRPSESQLGIEGSERKGAGRAIHVELLMTLLMTLRHGFNWGHDYETQWWLVGARGRGATGRARRGLAASSVPRNSQPGSS